MSPTISSALDAQDLRAVRDIAARIPGWSGDAHYAFFKTMLAAHPAAANLLVLGVYHGRDIAFILDILRRHHPGRVVEIVGVDLFEPGPCADWPPEKRAMSWETAQGCQPPSHAAAMANTDSRHVRILKMDDAEFFRSWPSESPFDMFYLDTAHDEATVLRQLAAIPRIARGDALVAGDDYSDAGTWGVKRAVSVAFTRHEVFAGWIWYSHSSLLHKSAP